MPLSPRPDTSDNPVGADSWTSPLIGCPVVFDGRDALFRLPVDGRAMLEGVLAESGAPGGPIWDDTDDADAAARTLTEVLERARAALRNVA